MDNESKDKDRVRVTIEFTKDHHRKLRVIAAYDETTMAEWIRKRVLELIEKELPK